LKENGNNLHGIPLNDSLVGITESAVETKTILNTVSASGRRGKQKIGVSKYG
jgi:hypothetical protein